MIIFARAPGTTGWVEINPEKESSHRGQFWEIRKFAVESDGIMPLARRLDRAEQALRAAGFQYHGPSEKWLVPKAPVGLGPLITDLEQSLARAQSVNGRWVRGTEYVEGLEKQIADLTALLPGNCYLDEPDGGSVTVLEQFRRMAADAVIGRDAKAYTGHVSEILAGVQKGMALDLAEFETQMRDQGFIFQGVLQARAPETTAWEDVDLAAYVHAEANGFEVRRLRYETEAAS